MRAVLTSVHGATAPTLIFTVLATVMHRTLALPPIQQLPSPQRPFIFIHPMKTGGSSLREVIRAGAEAAGVPKENIYIPCHSSLLCNTTTIPPKPLSVIAGHFLWQELKLGGIQDFDCLLSMRHPIDRATSCLFYFYGNLMAGVSHMTEDEFRRLALESTFCNNVAAAMLTSTWSERMSVNRASLYTSWADDVAISALANLERCIVIDLHDVTHGQVWADWAPAFLLAWFPWMPLHGVNASEGIPHENENPKAYKLPYRLVKVLEELNSVDMLVYNRATELMQLQQGFAEEAMGIETLHDSAADADSASGEQAAHPHSRLHEELQGRREIYSRSESRRMASKDAESAAKTHFLTQHR